jgi:hypothetical protein
MTMSSLYASQDSFGFELYEEQDLFEPSQTQEREVGHGGVTLDMFVTQATENDGPSQPQAQQWRTELGFCQPSSWNNEKTYDEDPPTYIHYTIEWKVTVNNRMVSKDTEQNVVLAPADH